ncbi:molybdopterin molybdotransferase MoeA [Cohnella hashimotonis]|uniref:Molybdopterin molybdenumtransferase n=1 Tax=Cohnella hashimotonis TaxID=2826895 RepID=A0ABT6TLN0_9BACL|nr:gephyrin-like molybdotransferase Glp [Cohnella hashimotonis]MDI4647168.1 molybdopterin molybdotransferase MoeA [Cohnella hashimotonis]
MSGRRDAISLEEAQRRILAWAKPIGADEVPLLQAQGLRLAEAARTESPMPAFARAGMDGYAVWAADLATASPQSPVLLKIVEGDARGALYYSIRSGEAMRVGTGGPLPEGADTVVMQEAVSIKQDEDGTRRAVFLRSETAGRHVTARGAEAAAGSVLIAAGTRIGPGQAALLASLGAARPCVYRKPRIVVVTAGDDVVPVESEPGIGQVRNGNLPMLRMLIESAAGETAWDAHVPDEPDQAQQTLLRGLADADLVIVSGGISVGDTDIMGRLFGGAGPGLLFSKLAIRPGSASSAIVLDGKLLIGLSGNPGACFAGFELLARPAIERLGGGSGELKWCQARLAEGSVKSNANPRFLRGVVWIEGGMLMARPCAENSSSGLISIGEANALLAIPPSAEETRAGATIDVRLLPGWQDRAWQ